MKIVKSVFKTVSMITLFSILTRFLGFIFRVYLSRKLGAEGIGIYQIATSIVGVFMTLVASGLPLTTAKLVAKYEYDVKLKEKNIATTASTVIALVISIISCIILLLGQRWLALIIKNQTVIELILIMCPALIFSAVYAVFRGSLWGQNSFFWVSFTELFEQAVRILLTYIVLKPIFDVTKSTKLVAFTFTITCLISAVFVIIVYLIKGGRITFKKGHYKNIIKSATPITGVRLASSFIQPLTALLIPLLLGIVGFSSSQSISIYGIIMGMSLPLLFAPLSIIGSLSMVMIPKISVMHENKDYSNISSSVQNSVNFSLFLSALIIPLYLSCGDLIGIVLYDNIQAGIYLQYSAVCVLPIVLNNITNSVLNALNMEVKSFINYIFGMIVMFVSLVSFTFAIKEIAIIFSMFLSTATTALLNVRMIKKTVPTLNLDIVGILFKYSLIILPSSVLGHLISNVLYHILPAFISGLIGGGISIITTLILIKVFNVYNFSLKIRHKKTN